MENQEHIRASYAWRCIEDIESHLDAEVKKKYRALVSSLPTRLQTIGLLQTLAFTGSKMKGKNGEEKHFVKLNLHLMKWILGKREADDWNENAAWANEKFTTIILVDLGTEKRMLMTRQALDLSIWLKRFAEGKWGKADEGGE